MIHRVLCVCVGAAYVRVQIVRTSNTPVVYHVISHKHMALVAERSADEASKLVLFVRDQPETFMLNYNSREWLQSERARDLFIQKRTRELLAAGFTKGEHIVVVVCATGVCERL
jgi:hypothetical protein